MRILRKNALDADTSFAGFTSHGSRFGLDVSNERRASGATACRRELAPAWQRAQMYSIFIAELSRGDVLTSVACVVRGSSIMPNTSKMLAGREGPNA